MSVAWEGAARFRLSAVVLCRRRRLVLASGPFLNLLHVMPRMQQVKLPPTGDWNWAQNGMIGDLLPVTEPLLARGQRLVHLFEIRKN